MAPIGDGGTASVLCFSSVFLSPIAQLHSVRANKRKAILNFSFPLEGNAAKRQRVYEVKNDNVAPLLLYAGPTLPDLAILCRIATWERSLTLWDIPSASYSMINILLIGSLRSPPKRAAFLRPQGDLPVFPGRSPVVKVFYKLAAKPPSSTLTAKGRVNLKNPRGERPVNL